VNALDRRQNDAEYHSPIIS